MTAVAVRSYSPITGAISLDSVRTRAATPRGRCAAACCSCSGRTNDQRKQIAIPCTPRSRSARTACAHLLPVEGTISSPLKSMRSSISTMLRFATIGSGLRRWL